MKSGPPNPFLLDHSQGTSLHLEVDKLLNQHQITDIIGNDALVHTLGFVVDQPMFLLEEEDMVIGEANL